MDAATAAAAWRGRGEARTLRLPTRGDPGSGNRSPADRHMSNGGLFPRLAYPGSRTPCPCPDTTPVPALVPAPWLLLVVLEGDARFDGATRSSSFMLSSSFLTPTGPEGGGLNSSHSGPTPLVPPGRQDRCGASEPGLLEAGETAEVGGGSLPETFTAKQTAEGWEGSAPRFLAANDTEDGWEGSAPRCLAARESEEG